MKISLKTLRRLGWISLVFVHLVIIAGSVVRMTGSGMGCPDWPKCFGYAIPPTNTEQVSWSPDRAFSKGQMIVHPWETNGEVTDRLLIAQSDFTTGEVFTPEQWSVYDKHDYSIFNPVHTWIEFINRLIGVLTGIPVLLLLVASMLYWFRSRDWSFFMLSAGVLFMLGFEAWLGKLVVDGNLIPGSITIHMFGAMVLVFLLLIIVRLRKSDQIELSSTTRALIIAAFLFSLIQILWGTQVREEVDQLVHDGVYTRDAWIDQLSRKFDIHRSFSWLVLLLNAGWVYRLYREGARLKTGMWIILLLLVQIGGGIVLNYAGVPAALQPVHLLGGILMFGVLWYTILTTRRRML